MEYYQYFRLKGPPFQPASPHGPVYFSPTHLEGLATLESGLTGELSGLTLLTGEAGTGKTTLIYSLLQRDSKRVRIAHIDDPKLSFLEMMQVIMTQLNLYSAGSTKLDYLNVLDHLLDLHGRNERIAIVIDESQVLSDDVLEEMRLLWNRGQRNGLQVVLVGHPELAERLKQPELRQLNQRISSRGVLKPLDSEQAAKYVECRLSAQGSSCSAIFEPRALNSLLKRSDGIPRKINMLCHTAMQAAFYGGEKKVSFKTAKRVAAQYRDSVDIVTRGSNRHPITMGALIAATAFAALLLLAFFHPSAWLDRAFGHSESLGGTTEAAVDSTEASSHVKSGGPTRAEEHLNSIAKSKTANHLAVQPELRTPVAPRVVASTATKSDAARQMTASEAPAAPSPPPLSEASSGLQKQAEVPAAPKHRNQVTVRYGDTIEKIAIRCFGSKAGINEIMEANPQLTNINQLSVGEVIYLPAGIAPKASQDETEPVRPLANADDSPDR